MRWVLMLFVVFAAVMGGEARIDCSAGPGGAWPIEGIGLGKRVLTAEAEMRLEPGAGELAAGEALAAWRGEQVAVLANLREADTATWNLEVENEHVYRVGPAGILVHNTCPTPKELFEGGGSGSAKTTGELVKEINLNGRLTALGLGNNEAVRDFFGWGSQTMYKPLSSFTRQELEAAGLSADKLRSVAEASETWRDHTKQKCAAAG